jgi:uncharacterized cupredoxin-like copper-binding protein
VVSDPVKRGGLLLLCGALFALGVEAASATRHSGIGTAVVTVTAGKPTEYRFTLSKVAFLPSRVTFKVTNRGSLAHQFEVCTSTTGTTAMNSCFGDSTPALRPGQSANLTVTFEQHGTYEFLSQTPGQAAKGMKGLLGIGVSLSSAPSPGVYSTPSSGGSGTAGTTTATGSTPSGAALFDSLGCSSCHTAVAAHAAGNVTASINSTHTGGAFPKGPLTPDQITALATFVNNS